MLHEEEPIPQKSKHHIPSSSNFKLPKAYSSIGEKLAEKYNKSRLNDLKHQAKSEHNINFGTGIPAGNDRVNSLSTTAIAPPVPDHWRKKGLPGGRNQFDKILEKARSNAHERILERQKSDYAFEQKQRELQILHNKKRNNSSKQRRIPNQLPKLAAQGGDTGDYQRKVDISQDFGEGNNFDEKVDPKMINNLDESNSTSKKINLSAMRLAPLDDY